ncbi:MAG: hypothetical protein LBI38_04780 [Oscillospiraceae bacterium]|jgi:hypothetical protein|nr:hypothetical protein [Oscillospiraceae bacterium]
MAGNWNKVMYQKRDGRDIYNEFSDVTDDDVEAFIDELYNCRFDDFNEAFGVDGYEHKKQVLLCFYMNDHTVAELLLVEGGYVGYRCMLGSSAGYFVQMPGEAFDKIFNVCIRGA